MAGKGDARRAREIRHPVADLPDHRQRDVTKRRPDHRPDVVDEMGDPVDVRRMGASDEHKALPVGKRPVACGDGRRGQRQLEDRPAGHELFEHHALHGTVDGGGVRDPHGRRLARPEPVHAGRRAAQPLQAPGFAHGFQIDGDIAERLHAEPECRQVLRGDLGAIRDPHVHRFPQIVEKRFEIQRAVRNLHAELLEGFGIARQPGHIVRPEDDAISVGRERRERAVHEEGAGVLVVHRHVMIGNQHDRPAVAAAGTPGGRRARRQLLHERGGPFLPEDVAIDGLEALHAARFVDPRALPFDVADDRGRREPEGPARLSELEREIDILPVGRGEALVEAAHLLERVATDHQRGTGAVVHGPRVVECALVRILAAAVVVRVAVLPDDAAGFLQQSVGVHELGSDRATAGPPDGVEQSVEPAVRHDRVVVEEQQERSARPLRAGPTRADESHVACHTDANQARDERVGPLRPIARPVVDQDHFVLHAGRAPGDRSEAPERHAPVIARRDDDGHERIGFSRQDDLRPVPGGRRQAPANGGMPVRLPRARSQAGPEGARALCSQQTPAATRLSCADPQPSAHGRADASWPGAVTEGVNGIHGWPVRIDAIRSAARPSPYGFSAAGTRAASGLIERAAGFGDDARPIHADETGDTGPHALRPLGGLAENQDRRAERRRFLLQPSAVCQHQPAAPQVVDQSRCSRAAAASPRSQSRPASPAPGPPLPDSDAPGIATGSAGTAGPGRRWRRTGRGSARRNSRGGAR